MAKARIRFARTNPKVQEVAAKLAHDALTRAEAASADEGDGALALRIALAFQVAALREAAAMLLQRTKSG